MACKNGAKHSKNRTIATTGTLVSTYGSRPGPRREKAIAAISGDNNWRRKAKLAGLPVTAEGHPRQCTHVSKITGHRCKRFACVWNEKVLGKADPIRCPRHIGGNAPTRLIKDAVPLNCNLKKMPMFYSKVLSKSLREYVEECCAQEPHQQLALWEELALMRERAGLIVGLYSKIKESFGETPTVEQMGKLMKIGDIMQLALEAVANMSSKQASILAAGKDKVTVFNIEYAVQQVVRIAYEAFGNSPEVVQFERMVRDNVKIAAGPEGTTLTPDQEALTIDSLVPEPDDVDQDS